MNDALKNISELSPEQKRARLAQLLQNKANEMNSFPLSFAQQRLWFLDQLEPNNPTYNIPAAFRLKGRLNVPVLEKSLTEIQRRHKVLHTKFVAVEGKPAQVIIPEMFVKLSVLDLQELLESKRETEMWRLIQEEVQRPFELSEGPLWRTTLFRLADEEHVLLLTMHHIISDGWSIGLFTREMIAHYQAFLSGNVPMLPELPIQYADFALRQREWLKGHELEAHLSYWRQQLSGVPPTLELSTDHPRSAVQNFQGARQSIELTKELTQALKKLSLKEGGTLFMTLLAAFEVLLCRYTGQEDLSVGTPIANRDQEDIENLIGFFVNALVLRVDLNGNPTFRKLLARVREVALVAYDHQDLPFEKLVEELQPQRDLSRSPLFQVMFSLQNTPSRSLDLPELTLEHLDVYNGMAKFDLTVYMWEEANGLRGVFEYNTALLEAPTITRMIAHFKNVLQGVVSNPDQRLSDLPMLTKGEREQLLVEWNSTEREYPREQCFYHLFEAQVERRPEATAVVMGEDELSYGELNRRANRLAHYLRKLGVGPDVLVGIYIERSLEMVIGLLGIMKAGGAYVPLDPSYPKERIGYMLEDAQPRVLLTQQRLRETLFEKQGARSEERAPRSTLPAARLNVISLDSDWDEIAKESDLNPKSNTNAMNLAYVIYTSGSTGKPKGVTIEHLTLVNFLRAMSEQPGLTKEDRLLAVTTLSFDIAGLELYLPLMVGARVILASREVVSDGLRLREALASFGATVMQATPATWRLLLDSGWEGSKRLKMLCGGEALPRELANRLLDCGGSLWNMYGPTETTVWSAVCQIECKEGMVPVGPPIANTQIYLLDRDLRPVPVGVYGEVHIGGDGLARGYLKCPELTAEVFIPDPFSSNAGARMYRTGDLARYLANGNIEFHGRIDHQVKIRGFRIELGEIEAALVQHEAIDEVVVACREEDVDKSEKRLVAYLVSKADPKPTVSELRRFLQANLPDYMVPSAFVFLEAFPLTPNGKVDRRALPAPGGIRPELGSAFVAPQNEIERGIAGVWQEVLGVEKVGIDDNFFDLGGHSLLLVQVQSKLQKKFERELSIVDLFKYPTINALAKYFGQEEGESADFQKIHDKAKKQKDAFAQQKKLKEVKKNDGRFEYA
ncbi:amino acid adenylation domain-containing protein [candidate division KSB1 bacterium]|nr:amino acid adenylation domain-containing protein [candidate division KSB1 bacterium]NIV70713.1 amino acid adenylation domain-containing protein [Phycisphaerae bacterium]NIR72678.1 amino acid adenylation domain-containing protein [candidate division KSB1 bacterium]NIS23700.1 amino acid adenylation domain-containing protein [candidate division KSB1 bacterium]NIT70620.1 amino acid adenylation domain-containing protein [candidate division KSB1 bacterium]